MAYTLEEKLQIDAIKRNKRIIVSAINVDDWLLLENGYYGVYIRKDKLLLNPDSLRIFDNMPHLSMEFIENNYKWAKVTKEAMILANNRIVVKVREKEGPEYAWVNLDYLREFGKNIEVKILGRTKPIAVYSLGILRGVVLPVMIEDE